VVHESIAEVYQAREEVLMSNKGHSLSDQLRRHKLGNYVEGHDFERRHYSSKHTAVVANTHLIVIILSVQCTA